MREYYPILVVGATVGLVSAILLFAFFSVKDRKTEMGFERHMSDGKILLRLLKYAKPYWPSFIAIFFLLVISIAHSLSAPLIVGAVEKMLASDNLQLTPLFTYVAVYAGIVVISLLCSYIQRIMLQKVGMDILSTIREDLFWHIEELSHEQLNSIPVGTLVTRVMNDASAIAMMFRGVLADLLKNALIVAGVIVAMFALNYALALMVMCFAPFIVLFTVIFRKFSRRAHRHVKDATTDLNIFLSEHFSGMKIIQVFNREEKKQEELEKKNARLGRAIREQITVFGIFRPLIYMLYISSVLCLLYLGGRGYIANTAFLGRVIDGSVVVSFYMYLSKFFDPLQTLAEHFNHLQSAFASAEKIFTVMDIEPKIVDAPDAVDIENVKGEIEFKHVWFAYKPDEWVLKDVSFKVNAGDTVAFVGATGSGKTTILSLICRNYDIQKGEILLDGVDIRKIKIKSLRRQFGQMLQDVFLFSGDIRSNILLQKEGVSDEKVMEVCRYVNADKVIELTYRARRQLLGGTAAAAVVCQNADTRAANYDS